jgi:transcriptional regulator with XRE-family HTH domain
MRKSEESDPVRAYAAQRLRRETEGPDRVSVASIAEATGASAAHVSNVKNGKAGIGKHFEEALARYWGMSVEELRRVAAAEQPAQKPPVIKRLRDRPEWQEALAEARQFHRTFSEEELSAVGECYDHMDYLVTAEFIGHMARAIQVRRPRSRGHGSSESESGPSRKGGRTR